MYLKRTYIQYQYLEPVGEVTHHHSAFYNSSTTNPLIRLFLGHPRRGSQKGGNEIGRESTQFRIYLFSFNYLSILKSTHCSLLKFNIHIVLFSILLYLIKNRNSSFGKCYQTNLPHSPNGSIKTHPQFKFYSFNSNCIWF